MNTPTMIQDHDASNGSISHKDYVPALVESLRVDTVLNFDLFINAQDGSGYVLYRKQGMPFTQQNADHLRKKDEGRFYIATDDRKKFLQYLEQNLTFILKDESIPIEKKSTLLYHSAANTVSQVFNNPAATENIRRTSGMVSNISGHVIGNPRAFQSLLKLAAHDYHTYTHSVNVCTYSLMLADSMKEFSSSELKELGMGAVLHDIGKSRISDSIIRKSGPLTSDEWGEMKKHPQFGAEILADNEYFSANSMSIVTGHHEKLNGSGYPQGLHASEIGLMARITCVADIFDALTTSRPYKGAISSFDALMLMNREMSDQIDIHIFEHLILLLKVT